MHARLLELRPRTRLAMSRCAAIAAMTLLAGCSSPPKVAAAGARDQPTGLEAIWWIVDDSNHDRISFDTLGEALLQYQSRPTGLSPQQQRLWRENGLRVVAVPVKELDLLHDRLRTMGQAVDQWFGVLPSWTPLVTGPTFEEKWTLSLDSGPLDLQPGNVRMLGRAWMVPVEPSFGDAHSGASATPAAMAAAMNIELLPQHAESALRQETFAQSYGVDPKVTIEDAGLNFPRLLVSLSSLGGDALLIVPEDPMVEWKALPPGQPRVLTLPAERGPTVDVAPPLDADASSTATPVRSSAVQRRTPASQPLSASKTGAVIETSSVEQAAIQFATALNGPAPAHQPTLGEAMLADVRGVGLPRRVVLILVPRVPETYELIVR